MINAYCDLGGNWLLLNGLHKKGMSTFIGGISLYLFVLCLLATTNNYLTRLDQCLLWSWGYYMGKDQMWYYDLIICLPRVHTKLCVLVVSACDSCLDLPTFSILWSLANLMFISINGFHLLVAGLSIGRDILRLKFNGKRGIFKLQRHTEFFKDDLCPDL